MGVGGPVLLVSSAGPDGGAPVVGAALASLLVELVVVPASRLPAEPEAEPEALPAGKLGSVLEPLLECCKVYRDILDWIFHLQ